jgi:hypothetical protein
VASSFPQGTELGAIACEARGSAAPAGAALVAISKNFSRQISNHERHPLQRTRTKTLENVGVDVAFGLARSTTFVKARRAARSGLQES